MLKPPVLETPRLWLQPLETSDANAIQQAARSREIADTMISLPHPYPEGEAERYIAHDQVERSHGRAVTYTIKNKVDDAFCGLVELRKIDHEHLLGELSFWIVCNAWGQGYMSEALGRVVQYGFEDLGLNRLYAYHMLRNPASGRVLEKNGFKQEGLLRERVKKWGTFEDVALWAILKHVWETGKSNAETGI
jgi:RimJ/RimL family protein N-acetyltransferase